MSIESIIATLGELTGDAICIFRDHGKDEAPSFAWANTEYTRLKGCSIEEMESAQASLLPHAVDCDRELEKDVEACLASSGQWTGQALCRRVDGSAFWAHIKIRSNIEDEKGERYVLHAYRDIGVEPHKETELAAKAPETDLDKAQLMEQRLRAAVEAFQGSFAIYDPDLTLVLCNSRYKEELANRPDDIQPGMTMWEVGREAMRSGKMIVQPGLTEEETIEFAINDTRSNTGVPIETHFSDDRVCLSLRTHSENGDYIISRTDVTEVVEQRRKFEEMNEALTATLEERELLMHAIDEARERLSAGMEALPDAFAIFDQNYELVICNHVYASEWSDDVFDVQPGMAFRDLVKMGVRNGKLDTGGRDLEEFLDDVIPNVFMIEDEPVVSEFRPGRFVRSLRRRAPNGDLIVLRTDISELVLKNREVEAINAQLVEALEEGKALALAAQKSEQRLAAAIDAIPDGFAMFDVKDRLVAFNAAFSEIYPPNKVEKGINVTDIIRLAFEANLAPVSPEEQAEYVDLVMRNWTKISTMEKVRTPDGRHFEINRNISETKDKILFRRDVTDLVLQTVALEDAQQEMEHQATHDALTGVRNRRGLNEALDELIKHGEGQETGACVLHVDLDRFKGINDTLGHAAGDFVLQHVATVLKELSGEDAIIARVGGDEFVIAFACAHCGKRGLDLANSIVARAAEPVIFQGKECQIGASVGVAAPPYGGRTSSELLVNSDIALYRAKNAGRNRAQLFDADLAHEVEEQKELADAVTIGLARGEFVPVYQPQFCAQTHDLIGVETLARWQHPEKGLLTPDKFLGIAEGLGAVARIDAQIFESAVHECLALYQHGIEIPAVSFNVSIDRVRHPKLVQHMKELGPLPFAIGFELLESIFIEEEDDLFLMRLDQLRDLGARIELDDFGSGRASIIALTRIGADRLKIDQRLVRPIEESESARRLIKACIDIGSALGIGVLAEGVETPGQADILRELGCSCFQGYLYAKPMRMDDLRSFLAKEAWRTQPKATLRTA